MTFNTLIESNSIINDGMLMDKIILILNSNKEINEEEKRTLNNALIYIELIINGKDFIVYEKPIKEFDRSLKAFNACLKGLNRTNKDLTLEKIDEILENSKNQIKTLLFNKYTKKENSLIAISLFDSLRVFFIEEANNLSNKERTFF